VRIYVASSWRNETQPHVVRALRAAPHDVYDFRNPGDGERGFAWSAVDPAWKSWNTAALALALRHPIAQRGFGLDFGAMQWADGCVLVLPCGRSAHLEAGWMAGAGKRVIIYVPADVLIEPELMYLLCEGHVTDSLDDVLAWAAR